MRFIFPLLALCTLSLTGCRVNEGRLNTTWEQFLMDEQKLAVDINKNMRRSYDQSVRGRTSLADDWNRNVGREIDLITSPPQGRDSASGRFLAWEKANARIYRDETVERIKDMARADGFKPSLGRFFKEELNYTWYSRTEMPYRNEHPWTADTSLNQFLRQEKELIDYNGCYMNRYRKDVGKTMREFIPYTKEFFAREMRPFP